MRKALRLFPKDPNAHWFVLPTPHLRALVSRRLKQKLPHLNYEVWWLDKHGYGLQLAHADWVPPGGHYFNP